MSNEEEETTLSTVELDKILRVLSQDPPSVRVGILGGDAVRSGESQANNAEIGSFHEYGTTQLPQRSFLRVPIAEHLQKKLEEAGAFEEEAIKEVMASGDLTPFLKKVGIVAEAIVAEAFKTGGGGKWKPSDMTHKKNAQTLVETQQLRNAITSEVKEGSG